MTQSKIYISPVATGLGLFLIFLATVNPALRPSTETPITPFYIAFPFAFAWVFSRYLPFRKAALFVFLLLFSGLMSGYIYGTPWDIMILQSIKYIQLLSFLGLIYFLISSNPKNRDKLLNLSFIVLYIVLIIAALQYAYNFEIPTVINEESHLWINTVFYTPNDLALFLGAMLCLILHSNMSLAYRVILVALIIALNLRNDSKAVLLACIIYMALFYGLLIFKNLGVRQIWSFPFIILVAIPITVLGLDASFDIYETNFDFTQLFLDPLDRIWHLDPYNLGGSIYDRTDALIYNFEALSFNNYIGLGPGGSVYLLSLSNYELLTAKSLHNALAEFLFEFGFVGLLVLIYVAIPPLVKALRAQNPTRSDIAKVAFTLAVPFLSVSQSSGFISNYAFWLAAFLLWVAPAEGPVRFSSQGRTLYRPFTTNPELA
jgi:O-antigen ligase